MLSWRQSRICLLIMEATGHQCLRRNSGVEVRL
jgi:hypothetical protein